MADNTVLNPGVGGDTVASDDIGGIKYQRVKVTWGGDGIATDVDAGASAMPVALASTTVAIANTAVSVAGNVTLAATTIVAIGDTTSGATDGGNPIKIGARADTALPTAVTAGQRVNLLANKFGSPIVEVAGMRDIKATARTTISNTTVETTVMAGVASVFLDVEAIIVNNTSGSPTRVDIRDTTGGSVITEIYATAGQVSGVSLAPGYFPQTSVAGNWTAQCSASVTDIRITLIATKRK